MDGQKLLKCTWSFSPVPRNQVLKEKVRKRTLCKDGSSVEDFLVLVSSVGPNLRGEVVNN